MTRSRLLIRLAAPALLLAVVAAGASCAPGEEVCVQCGRHECRNLAFEVVLADGETVNTCCPRCGLHYLASETPDVASLHVRDFNTAGILEARSAWYVEGSEVHPCRGVTKDPPRDERGCCLLPAFDRCEPSVVAFADRDAARRFITRFGGTLTDWNGLVRARDRS